MTAILWTGVESEEFTGNEAREASDFSEIIGNLGLSPEEAYEMFKKDGLSIGKRLYFAVRLPSEKATAILLLDPDDRIGRVVSSRLKREKEKSDGPVVITG